MKKTYVIYTHTDMEDVWGIFFEQFNKFIDKENKIYIGINKISKGIPASYIQILYEDSKQYTERWKQLLDQVEEEVFIFLHEDMILYNKPNDELLTKYFSYVEKGLANSIKLIFAGTDKIQSNFDSSLVTNEYSVVSVQPTVIRKKYFIKILSYTKNLSIWNFENFIANKKLGHNDFMVFTGAETQRGQFHYNSFVFPYIATAIAKGKWNISEYHEELIPLINKHNIDINIRGKS